MEKQSTDFKSGDKIIIEYAGERYSSYISIASPNGYSLMTHFDAMIAGHVGMMPLTYDGHQYRMLLTGDVVTVRKWHLQ